jgi:hypothetical protein
MAAIRAMAHPEQAIFIRILKIHIFLNSKIYFLPGPGIPEG